MHFGDVVRDALPGVAEVLTVSNACSASGYALALAQDLLDADEADAVVVAGTDSLTLSLLAVMGRGSAQPSEAVRPFDRDRRGVLLGEGAAAVVLEARPSTRPGAEPALGVLHSVGLSCDAHHETAPHAPGIAAAMQAAYDAAGVTPADVGLVVAHGTGTALNDPLEAATLADAYQSRSVPVTAIKGGTGHTSGAAALMSVIVAAQAMRSGAVPPITGLRDAIDEAQGLDLVTGAPRACDATLAQVDAFGFGGVNAVALVGAAT
nr:beta-ketoacyl synthase N-terminal-like domain-containing protein [Motilibacter deserti]